MILAVECATEALLKNSFNSLSFTDKLNIIQKDRPKGTLENLSCQCQYKGLKGFMRHFNVKSVVVITWTNFILRLKKCALNWGVHNATMSVTYVFVHMHIYIGIEPIYVYTYVCTGLINFF